MARGHRTLIMCRRATGGLEGETVRSNAKRVILAIALSSVASLVLPLAALLVLVPADYGAFSLLYLVGALGNIFQLSIVSESWIRALHRQSAANSWDAYSNATLAVGVVVGAAGAAAALSMGSTRTAAPWVFLAILLQVYRNGARFRSFHDFKWRYVLTSDALGAAATLVGAGGLLAATSPGLHSVLVMWALSRLAAVVGTRAPARPSVRQAYMWVRTHRREIRVLVTDSTVHTLSSIGTPFMLAPVLGLAQLGTYRSIDNIGSPVRSLIAPLRPALSRLPPTDLGSVRLPLLVASMGILFGSASYGALHLLSQRQIDLGTLNSVYPFSAAAAVYMTVMIGDSFYSLVARQVAPAKRMVGVRTAVSTLGIALPISGALIWGLPGAIWGFVLHLGAGNALWWMAVRASTHPKG